MTLTELKYIAAVARERHFGRAAEACFVSQPTLSVAVKKLEAELDVRLFERSAAEVSVTPVGEEIVRQALVVLEEAAAIREIARRGQDPLARPLVLGVIPTIGPYLLPELVRCSIERTPQMPLVLQENFTVRLLELLRAGELDCAILAEPFPDAGLATAALYDEPFLAAVPAAHPLARQASIGADELKRETVLLLGHGHCFRDHVLQVCPEFAHFSAAGAGGKNFEGSSLETIKHMVAAGMGVTLVPRLSAPAADLEPMEPAPPVAAAAGPTGGAAAVSAGASDSAGSASGRGASDASGASPAHPARRHIAYRPFTGEAPKRRVVLVWRRSFTRPEAIAALRASVDACELPGVHRLLAAG